MKTLLLQAKHDLRQAGIESYALDAELLLAHALHTTREGVIFQPQQAITSHQQETYQSLITRRLAREPMAQILGKREFWGREFKVTKDTLDPRPDSETLIETVLSFYKDKPPPKKILDLGTGTGCLLLTLLAEFPGAEGVGIDLSPPALAVAKHNALHLGLEKRVQLLLQCWAEGVTDIFDVIISNPPYIKAGDIPGLAPEVSQHEPIIALSGGEDGLGCYRQLIPQLAALLDKRGIAVLEIGEGQAEEISAIVQSNALLVHALPRDLAGVVRCVAVRKPDSIDH